MSFSANAILTKTRAMHGRGLTDKNYEELLSLSKVSDVASYLASQTQYSSVFSEITSSDVTRKMIENSLRKHLLNQFESICRFERAIGHHLYKYFIIRNEIDEIISCIRYLKTPNADEYLLKMPAFLNSLTTIDLFALAKARNFGEVIESLKKTDYEKILSPFNDGKETVDLLGIESALFKYLYSRTEVQAKESLKGKELKEFIKIVRIFSDLKMLSSLYRIKFIFGIKKDIVLDYPIFVEQSNLDSKKLSGLIDADNENDFYEILSKTQYGAVLKCDGDSFEAKTENYKYSLAHKNLIFSTYPGITMFCEIILAEYEIMNIIHITEGIKYNLPKEEIEKLLVGYNKIQ